MAKEVGTICSSFEWPMEQAGLAVVDFWIGTLSYISFCSMCMYRLGRGCGEAKNSMQESLMTEQQEV